jgi:DNA-directed RNA polymerase subunit RPC12/RpoP
MSEKQALQAMQTFQCEICGKPKKWKISKKSDSIICEYCLLFLSMHPRGKGESIQEWKSRMATEGRLK